MSVKITCSTDGELAEMLKRESYTEYYKSLIRLEIKQRNNPTHR